MTGDPDTRPDTDALAYLRRRHPLQYGFRSGVDHAWVNTEENDDPAIIERYNRCPECEQWSPCDVRRLMTTVATLQQLVALLLDGQTPQPDGHWYAPDENGDPHYINDPVTPEQKAELDAIRDMNGVGE